MQPGVLTGHGEVSGVFLCAADTHITLSQTTTLMQLTCSPERTVSSEKPALLLVEAAGTASKTGLIYLNTVCIYKKNI